jgi:murein DD-endopeptidase
MKIFHQIGLCLFLLSMQTTIFAANKIHDKQLLQAYNVLFNKPVEKTATVKRNISKKTAAKKPTQRTPQVNATLVAKKQINKKYKWGGTNPYTGFDCSGLMQYAYKASRVHLPRTAAAQYKHTKRVSMKNLKVGDLIFFHTRRTRARVNHVGIYLGGGKFIHAPRRGKLVSITDLNSYWRRKAVGAGRV